jgi:hypothetical protein
MAGGSGSSESAAARQGLELLRRAQALVSVAQTSTRRSAMISFSDSQLEVIMAAAARLPRHHRDDFLKLVAGQLKVRDVDVADATERALRAFEEQSCPPPRHAQL